MKIARHLALSAAAILLIAVATPTLADGMTTADLRKLCATPSGTTHRLTCAGYIVGYADGAAMVASITGRLPWCSKNADIERAFLRYSKAHPEEDGQQAAVTIYFAMQEAYPCK